MRKGCGAVQVVAGEAAELSHMQGFCVCAAPGKPGACGAAGRSCSSCCSRSCCPSWGASL